MMNIELEIPDFVPIGDWKSVHITECGEPLVLINNIDPQIEVDPQYFYQQIQGTSPDVYLRAGAAERLLEAARLLPHDYRLLILDGFRPIQVQQALFDAFFNRLRQENPEKPDKELTALTQTYVSLPSVQPERPSPHATGGAVDLTLIGPEGLLLDMGAEFDTFDITARTDYFKCNPYFTDYHQNRRKLYQVMTSSGFTNYPEEFWHFDFGNQFWGKISSREAAYGLVESFPVADLSTPQRDNVSVIHRLSIKVNGRERFLRIGLSGSTSEDIIAVLDDLYQLPLHTLEVLIRCVDPIAIRHNVTRYSI